MLLVLLAGPSSSPPGPTPAAAAAISTAASYAKPAPQGLNPAVGGIVASFKSSVAMTGPPSGTNNIVPEDKSPSESGSPMAASKAPTPSLPITAAAATASTAVPSANAASSPAKQGLNPAVGGIVASVVSKMDITGRPTEQLEAVPVSPWAVTTSKTPPVSSPAAAASATAAPSSAPTSPAAAAAAAAAAASKEVLPELGGIIMSVRPKMDITGRPTTGFEAVPIGSVTTRPLAADAAVQSSSSDGSTAAQLASQGPKTEEQWVSAMGCTGMLGNLTSLWSVYAPHSLLSVPQKATAVPDTRCYGELVVPKHC